MPVHPLAAEQAIAHYADLYDSAPVGYFRLDRNGTIIEANLTGAGLLGVTRASLHRKRLEEFISIDMHASFNAFLKEVFHSDSKETCELRFLDSDRKAFFAHLEANADKERETCRLVLCDISDRKQAELSLIESEERFRLMADSAPVLIWITGPQRDYLWFNRMWLDFTGRPLEDELGDGWTDGIHPDDIPACINAHAAAFRSRHPFTLEYRLRNRNGQYHTMLAHGVPRLSPLGRFLGYIGTCTDITERKKMEDALQHSREMLRHLVSHQERVREDERKRIARELHDDLGQNLLALRIDVAMLHDRTRTHSRLNDRVRLALSHIDATMKAVRAAINNLRPTVLDLGLNAAIEWQVQDFQRRSGIQCELHMEDDIILDDNRATALFRILQESLNNVIRHAKASHVEISLATVNGKLYLQVADNGIGIYPDCRRKANSFGLIGIEERIIALGGDLDIESDPRDGTTLTVSIPLDAA
ncbi:PAS domain-containing sensor histidine kinase [Noviherbaspirillum denitrificans]|uniref:PAS domain-containing sensor histidine kinase n=1 Tax=Noviherbaspirillum denitrificans TaxID=1968433 RepID=UPI00148207D5|nr:PAS domain S-box protein [Noviherbaspirillum denitrificans]